MKHVEVFKALANESRLKILQWLKDPKEHFGNPASGGVRGRKVCVSVIQSKLGLSQSTASQYLAILEQAGLVTATRDGQWTFYERSEEALKEIDNFLEKEL